MRSVGRKPAKPYTAFGSKTGDVLTWATSIIFGVFLLIAVNVLVLGEETRGRTLEEIAGTQVGAPALQR